MDISPRLQPSAAPLPHTLTAALARGQLTTSVEAAAQVLGVSRGLAYEAARRGELPGVLRIGHRFVVSIPALLAALGARNEGEPR